MRSYVVARWAFLSIVLCATGVDAGSSRYGQECGERSGSSPTVRSGLCCLLPFCSKDEDECQCHRECCQDCGRKKPEPKNKSGSGCFGCKAPPRGEVAVSLAARIPRDGFRESAQQNRDQAENARQREQRLDGLERDLTRLTVVVEEIAKGQQKQQEDLTKVTLVLERLVEKTGGGGQ
ncbi:MAG: hypothetical protein ACKO2L_02610 [Planctomycetaceae bacterium]